MSDKIKRIASEILGIKTLDVQGRDALDFHDLNVVLIKDALEAAFKAGQESKIETPALTA